MNNTRMEFFKGAMDEVRLYNRALTPEEILSLYMDTIAPNDPTDVESSDHTVNVYSSDNTITMTWSDAEDPETDNLDSGVDGYAYDFNISSSPSCDQLLDLLENITSVTSSALANGSWYFHICTADNAGNWSSTIAVGPFLIDASPPVAGTVNDGTGADIDTQSITTISANWSGFSDSESGITNYEWAIGTTPGGIDAQAFTGVGLATGATNFSLSPTHGATYYVTVRATNGAGSQTSVSSDGVTTLWSNHFNGWRPPLTKPGSKFRAGRMLPVKFLIVDGSGAPVTIGVSVTMSVGSCGSAVAVLDDADKGQWKANVKLSPTCSGSQAMTITGNVLGVVPKVIQIFP